MFRNANIPQRSPDAMERLFTYGTLMCEDILYSVTGVLFQSVEGLLRDYSRHPVIGEVYPGIRPKMGEKVNGLVCLNLPERVWPYLDRFEGEMYERRLIRVECRNMGMVTSWTYVVRSRFIPCLDSENDWDFHGFLSAGKKTFLRNYSGYAAAGRQPYPPVKRRMPADATTRKKR